MSAGWTKVLGRSIYRRAAGRTLATVERCGSVGWTWGVESEVGSTTASGFARTLREAKALAVACQEVREEERARYRR